MGPKWEVFNPNRCPEILKNSSVISFSENDYIDPKFDEVKAANAKFDSQNNRQKKAR